MHTFDTSHTPTHQRPLGFWLRTVDALLDRAFAEALSDEDVSRRDWMLLNAVDGAADAPGLAERLARRSGRVRRLVERGWITQADDGWALTDEGRAARDRLQALVDGIRERVSGAVSPEDFATTMASLEAIARELGWDESRPIGFGGGRPWGRGFGRGFGPRHGFGPHGHRPHPGHGFGTHGHPAHLGHGFTDERCAEHSSPDRGRGRRGRGADAAFERGFTAGFAQGRGAASDGTA